MCKSVEHKTLCRIGRVHYIGSTQFGFCGQSVYEMLTLIYVVPMMDDLRVLKGSLKIVNSTARYVNSLVMDANVINNF